MGDRCYFQVWVRSEDARTEEGRSVLHQYFDEDEGPVETYGPEERWRHYEMNYGGLDFTVAWAKTGFLGWAHQEGGSDYGASKMLFGTEVAGEEDFLEWCVGANGGYVIDFDSDGVPEPGVLEAVKHFIECEKKVRALLSASPLEQLADVAEEDES